MNKIPFDKSIVGEVIEKSRIENFSKANIREVVRLANQLEEATGEKYIRMEMGVPGLESPSIGVEAEIEALRSGVAAYYPMIEGVDELKYESSRFIKNFINLDIPPACCIPTVGSLQASMTAFMTISSADQSKDTVLLIDPGFPVHKQQLRVLNIKYECFDVYEFRGEKLRAKLESYLATSKISTILYSNPNNPSWICFNEEELQIIAELADKYDVVVMEDLAYLGMDFRKDISLPGKPPYQVSVGNYTNNYILLISSSKIFSFAGQRTGILAMSNQLNERMYPNLVNKFNTPYFGRALIYGALYPLSAGTNHSSQLALTALFRAASDGKYNFVKEVREYGERAALIKNIFTENNFRLVYDLDVDVPIADGFYFTIDYPGLSGDELLRKLLYFGISAISLEITGSNQKNGIRACVSQIRRPMIDTLKERVEAFSKHQTEIEVN